MTTAGGVPDVDAIVRGAGQLAPPGFGWSTVRVAAHVARPRDEVWAWLCDPSTFVDGQLWPYRVEFLHEPGRPAFAPGVRNDHHGPLLSLPGVLGEVDVGRLRDLHYLYGAYVGSPRVARPALLRIEVADAPGGGTTLTVTTRSAVRRWARRPWEAGNRWFWRRFARWCEAAIDER